MVGGLDAKSNRRDDGGMISFSTMDFSTGGVYWPTQDENSPEYAHLTDIAAQTAFEVTAQDVEMLISANRFQPEGQNNIIVLGIRGSVGAGMLSGRPGPDAEPFSVGDQGQGIHPVTGVTGFRL